MNFGKETHNRRELGYAAHVANNLRNINFDPTFFEARQTASGLYITAKATSSGSESFEHQFKTEILGNNSFSISSGQWVRNTDMAELEEVTIDPFDIGIIPAEYNGDVYNYVVRARSDGGFADLCVVCSGNEIPDNQSSFKMEELVSIVSYTDGVIDTVYDKTIVGGINDRIETGEYIDNFGIVALNNNVASIGNVCSIETGFIIGAGEIRRRDEYVICASAIEAPITENKKVWVQLGDVDLTTKDISLIPSSPTVEVDTAYPAYETYQNNFFKLYDITYSQISLDAPGGSSGLTYDTFLAKKYHSGAIYDDWVRPDGKDSGITAVDNTTPEGKTINFVTTGAHEGELQDLSFYESVCLNGLTYFGDAGDQVIPWYEWSSTTTSKTYARLDAVNSDSHGNSGKSLRITSGYAELYKFMANNPVNFTNARTQSPTPYRVLVRDDSGVVPELKYADISSLKVDSAYSADYAPSSFISHNMEAHSDWRNDFDTNKGTHKIAACYNSTQWGWYDIEDITDGGEFDDRFWPNTGVFNGNPNSYNYWTSGSVKSGTMETGSIDVTSTALDALDVDGGAIIAKILNVDDTTAASGTGTGAFILDGGGNIKKNLIVQDTQVANLGGGSAALKGALSVPNGGIYAGHGIAAYKGSASWAGVFTDTVTGVGFANGSEAIYADGGSGVVKIGGTTKSIDVILGDYYHNGVAGVTGDGFSGGLKTSATDSNDAEEARVNDLLVGWGLL